MKEGGGTERERDRDRDPGVPEALPRTLAHLAERVGVERMDRVWIFPPLRRGRKERGLVAVSLRREGGERRTLVTASYVAERTGRELRIEPSIHDEGEAPPELLPRVMEGVVRRSGDPRSDPREVEIEGSPGRFEGLLEEFHVEPWEERIP